MSSTFHDSIGKPLRLGKPLHRTGTNHLLFRVGADVPLKALGARVVDSSMTRTVGSVYDIFGPVENPFLTIKLSSSGDEGTTDYLAASYFVLLEQRRPKSKNAHEARKFTRSSKFSKNSNSAKFKPKRG